MSPRRPTPNPNAQRAKGAPCLPRNGRSYPVKLLEESRCMSYIYTYASAGTHQVLKDEVEAVVCVDHILQLHDVGV